MATQRSEAEIQKIVDHCVALEQDGGDILGYLGECGYVTPRATWFNFQRERLARKPGDFSDGKPHRLAVKHGADQRVALAEAILTGIKDGSDPIKILEGLGYRNAKSSYSVLRSWLKKNRPDILEQLPASSKGTMKKEVDEMKENTGRVLPEGAVVTAIQMPYGEFSVNETGKIALYLAETSEQIALDSAEWVKLAVDLPQILVCLGGEVGANEPQKA